MNSSDFLLEDYKLKIQYLTKQFNRMWNRFNFFISIESGFVGFMLLPLRNDSSNSSDNALYFVVVGIFISLIWWIFGAQDRAVVKIYRSAVKNAAKRIAAVVQDLDKADYDAQRDFVGNTEILLVNNKQFNPIEWRWRRISVTRLAAFFPLTILFLWLVAALFFPLPLELRECQSCNTLKKAIIILLLALNFSAISLGIARSGDESTANG
ncbi:MAG: hypothetical protein M3436_13450 [Pseudomonadota bacterium]|nr:hypothetical protein [Pseudomonadota bacterium]